jgi:hypothetical protein
MSPTATVERQIADGQIEESENRRIEGALARGLYLDASLRRARLDNDCSRFVPDDGTCRTVCMQRQLMACSPSILRFFDSLTNAVGNVQFDRSCRYYY